MIFPPNFEEKISFDHIRQMLVDMCVSSMGKEYVEKMRFETVFNRIERKVSQVFEFLEILKYEQPFPAQNYFNLIPELQRIRLSGTYILQEQLFDLKSSLESLNEVIVYLQKLDSAKYTLLSELVEDKRVDRVILNEIYSIIDEKGNVKDTASETLRDIRQRLIKLSGEIEKAVRQVLVTAKKSGWLNPNDEITIRNGRMVIPVPAANKRKIRGFVHDESATGQTVYIEPAEALDANNEILELRNAEKREIIRILTSFTDNLRPKIEELIEGYRFLGLIDFIRAKALLAGKINGTKPFMSNEPLIDWRKALHPLLFLVHQKQKKHVEPLDILLNKENRILIISGPNAGGKSVCLKTTGLIQYMLQCGLLVPMDDNSKTGVFKDIFIDIGDEQSIEDDLSTYTSHLRNMKHLALKANKNSLFLIDEFGSGTEPQLGGAIAEAILEHLNNKGAFGVITTHYANLKHLAGKTPGLINGAMLFDTREMRPLYRLQIGNPGSSFAFEIAKKTGFPWFILRNAERKIGKTQIKFEQQLQQLELEKKELTQKQQSLNEAEKQMNEAKSKYDELTAKLIETKEKTLSDARSEAQRIIADSNKLVENTIREIKEAQAAKERTKKIREKLKVESERILAEPQKKSEAKPVEQTKAVIARSKKEKSAKEDTKILIGNRVRILPQQTVGEVIEITGGEAIVSFGSIMMRAKLEKLVNVGEEEFYQQVMIKKRGGENIFNELNTRMANFSVTLDVRGMRAEEAATAVIQYMDEALLLNIKEVKIIHGKGDGILRKVVRDNLRSIDEVIHIEDEHIERGGSGATVVRLK